MKLIGYYLGQFCLIIAGLNLITLAVSIFSAPWSISACYAIIIFVLFLVWLGLRRMPVPGKMQTNEAMVLAALVFLATAVLMTIPLMVNGVVFMDALFETTSAITTTGLSTLPGMEGQPLVFSFSRS